MSLTLQGTFYWFVYDKHGMPIDRRRFTNGLTQGGIHDLFDIYFSNGSTASAWYIGLIDNTGYTAVDDEDDTMASHSGWTEITDYDESTRPAWAPDAAASQIIANSAKATFTFNAAKSVKGMFLTSDNTKDGTSGVLWCTGIADVVQSVQPGQTLKAYYSLTGQEG